MRDTRRCLDRAVAEGIDRTAQDLMRVWNALPQVEAVMRCLLPSANGHSYDGEARPTIIWCDEHEQPVTSCHRHDLPCTGTPDLDGADPTGSAAVELRVWADVRETRVRVDRMRADADWLIGMANRYRDADPTPARERLLEDANRPQCERHLRYGHEREARSSKGTKVRRKDGTYVFTEAHRLCEWCEDFARDFGRLATEQEIRHHVDGKRLMRPA